MKRAAPRFRMQLSMNLAPTNQRPGSRGFTLVITLTLMVLLTVVAVGLLSLAAVTLRTSGQSEAMAVARANARMAMMLAIGDLQAYAGPDQRVTARADVTGETIANPMLTGVWKSWDIKAVPAPAPAEFEKSGRDAKFKGWLVSGADPRATQTVAYAGQAPAAPVTLWGEGSLGPQAAAEERVNVSKVPVAATGGERRGAGADGARGAVAWAVLDEGVKARVNTRYADDAASTGNKTQTLGAGERPGVEFIGELKNLQRKFFLKSAPESAAIDKGVSRLNFGLSGDQLAKGTREELMPLLHDVTTHSLGLFTDTAKGGLRQDFDSLINLGTLPSVYQGKGVYASRLATTSVVAPSDPTWASLREFARIYRDKLVNSSGPLIRAQAPTGWNAASVDGSNVVTINKAPPQGVLLLPTVAKVQVLFSLVGRDLYGNLPPAPIQRQLKPEEKTNDIHGPQDGHFRGSRFDYDLHLMYTPIITLHNPYNVALEFNNMRVDFLNVPFSMIVYRNGVAQSTGMVPMETMYADNDQGQNAKTFGINLKTESGGVPGSTTFRMMPGEVKMFSPYLDPSLTYTNRGTFWDIYVGSNKTRDLDAMPGWRGNGIGYDCDWLAGGKKVDEDPNNGHWASCFGLAWDDKIHAEFVPITLPGVTKFVVRLSAAIGGTNATINAIELDYETNDGLKKYMESAGVQMPMRYPRVNAVPNYYLGWQMIDRGSTPIGGLVNVKPFALMTVQGKTTSGARDSTREDGRIATKPWCFGHANIGASSHKVVTEHSANASHEFDLQMLENGTNNLLQVDGKGRGNFITGHSSQNGAKFGAQYDIPLAPIQTLPGLNGANPGGSSGYLPRVAQPIGNSWAPPSMSANKITETKAGVSYVDHSFMMNLALYDGFYFSGLADQSGPFCTPAKTSTTLAADFASGTALSDPRMIFRAPDGRAAKEFTSEAGKPAGYANLAGWQLFEGAFNVNSTSVAAWKAMLASIHDKEAVYNQLNKVTAANTLSALPATKSGESSRISRFRLPASKSAADGGEPQDGYWLGGREYSDAELQKLAENIVKQVRARGPFLSLADFVNRRLGSGTDPKALRGALQQAIDDSEINRAIASAAGAMGAGFEIPEGAVNGYKYNTPAAGAGSSYQGAPGYLTQADILNVLGNAATARSDTFTVRGYGEARDDNGKVLARATCEAVVQRFPEWLDSADKVETPIKDLTSTANKNFGRRFHVVSFRWLNSKEI